MRAKYPSVFYPALLLGLGGVAGYPPRTQKRSHIQNYDPDDAVQSAKTQQSECYEKSRWMFGHDISPIWNEERRRQYNTKIILSQYCFLVGRS